MSAREVSRDFDTLSSVYDDTRQPLPPETVRGLSEFVSEHRWKSILEVGVGTGRIARPLTELGLDVVGVDISRGMLERAAKKGLPYLVRGSALHLPFRDRSFDVALFVHVLHILDDPGSGIREAGRVSRAGVLAVLDRPPEPGSPDRPPESSPREAVRRALTEAGYPDLLRSGPHVKERAILSAYPPSEIRVLSDREITEPLSRQLDIIEKRAYRHVLQIPPEVLAQAVSAARAQVGTRTVTYRRREAVAWWPRRQRSST